ncbi:sensor histidine kinase [Candidatus Leptofilum sp.]|uniref:sensor histidine kinase n=1 Tax=Candidatus Leptofilum sp. TaxID=3241576 RepID=UPI003B59B084
MSDILLLDWAIMAVSLFNTILLTWLGLTVVFNSERRDWGVWIATVGLLLGALFFVSHTAIIGLGLTSLTWRNMIFWWTVGLVPAIMLPYAWYIIMLWYAGYWNVPRNRLHQRQRIWLTIITGMLLFGLVALFAGVVLLAFPAPELNPLRGFIRYSIAGIPLLAAGYSAYVLLCIGLSLDALRQPAASRRVMGLVARRRAQPWLSSASLALMVVTLLVTGVVLWIVQDARQRTFLEIYLEAQLTIAILDLLISGIIAVVIVLLGRAVVSYEVFTGKTLPRGGLKRQWRQAVMLAIGYGIAIGGTIAIQLRSLYSLLLTAMLMTFFFAMVSWRTFTEREQYISRLRPFVASNRLVEQLIAQTDPQEVDFITPFYALCADVLDARVAYLAALGPMAPLVGQPIRYPASAPPLPSLANITHRFSGAEHEMISLDADEFGAAVWAIPLWSERGLSGVLLLGEKSDRGLYTQEEIEIARVISERLIDTHASAEMSRRLMEIQRQRLAQSQIIDQKTRRVLHDDILPDIQAALIALSSAATNGQSGNEKTERALKLMTDAHKQISDLLHDMPTTTAPEVARLGFVTAFQRIVENDFSTVFDAVHWQISTEAQEAAKTLPTLTAEVVFYAAREVVRNAAKHGRGGQVERPLTLKINMQYTNQLAITITDDGVGLGNSNTAGSGQGLALHSTMMAVVGGEVVVDTAAHQFTRVTLNVPTTPAAAFASSA